jgi:hypothetical protein
MYSHDPYEHDGRGSHGDYRAWRGTTVLCVQRGDEAVGGLIARKLIRAPRVHANAVLGRARR